MSDEPTARIEILSPEEAEQRWREDGIPGLQTPLTSSDERMHVLDESCWCKPTVENHGRVVAHQRQIKPGDRVVVDDPALAQLAEIFRTATGEEPPPNNEGVVDEVVDDGTLLIVFDDGQCAPYSAAVTRRIG